MRGEPPTGPPGYLPRREMADTLEISLRSLERMKARGCPVLVIDGWQFFQPDRVREWHAAGKAREASRPILRRRPARRSSGATP